MRTPHRPLLAAATLLAALGLLLGPLATEAAASPIQVFFTGTVTSVGSSVTGTVNVGDGVSGAFIYDPALGIDIDPTANVGQWAGGVVTNFDVTLGSYTASYLSSAIAVVRDDFGGTTDSVSFPANLSGAAINGFALQFGQFGLVSSVLTRLSSDALPSPAELAGFLASEGTDSLNYITFDAGAPLVGDIRWNLTSFSVPEPSLGLLAACVWLGAAAVRRRAV